MSSAAAAVAVAVAAPSREKYQALLATASKTAGSDNWKTSAGRVDGPDGFVASDAWRLLKLQFKHKSRPSVCPICMDKPSSDDEWYTTKSCKHTVCRDCLQSYAASLMADDSHTGPLKCPCCPRLLRVEDAKVALGNYRSTSTTKKKAIPIPNAVRRASSMRREERGGLFSDPEIEDARSALDVLEKWDNKTRNEFLRSMRDFRPCPHCSGSSQSRQGNDSTADASSKNGGGFVTPDCLAPINEERESNAERLMGMTGTPSSMAVLLAYAIYYLRCGSIDLNSPILQLLLAILPSMLLPALMHGLRLLLAARAKREIMRPIIVTCPCCQLDFNLEASSELQLQDTSSDNGAEAASQSWKNSNTRPCPGCASPIMKDGGCNHVKCGRCKLDFCWACMRSRSRCHAYQCKNGAPYGNAFGDGSEAAIRDGLTALERERGRQGQTLMERIDHIESVALRNLAMYGSWRRYGPPCFGTLCLIAIGINPFQPNDSAGRILSLAKIIVYFCLGTISTVIVCGLLAIFISRLAAANGDIANVRGPAGAGRGQQRNVVPEFQQRRNITRQRSWLPRRFRTEEELLAEAIERSLVEQ